mmetsp:Transcript_7974/g.11791  ORF Transcript_7974/g.11791 Transcript_7974/m.11791 type:complete len:1472 (+) Transcript_7974:701-5116(+)
MEKKMPLNLSDILEKLQSRLRMAHDWIARVQKVVPIPIVRIEDEEDEANSDGGAVAVHREWLGRMRAVLGGEDEDVTGTLLELATEGSRIPVEMDCLRLLQIEIDARNWTAKAKKLVPSLRLAAWEGEDAAAEVATAGVRKSKVSDIRDHIARAASIRERLSLSPEEKKNWVLDAEATLILIVKNADEWFKKYKPYLEGDNRRNQARCCISVKKLRQIVDEANAIPANLGNAMIKINRIFSQAEKWMEKHHRILVRCGIDCSVVRKTLPPPSQASGGTWATRVELQNAVSTAASDVPVDLEEALELQHILDKVQDWFDRATIVAPKRSTRMRKNRGSAAQEKYSLDELSSLVEEASILPVDTGEELERLKIQLSMVQSWQLQAQRDMRDITNTFHVMRKERTACYGAPDRFQKRNNVFDEASGLPGPVKVPSALKAIGGNSGNCTASSPESGAGMATTTQRVDSPSKMAAAVPATKRLMVNYSKVQPLINVEKSVHKMIATLLKSARSIGARTAEERIAELLEKVSPWCVRASCIIASPDEVFEKKYFKELDNFIQDAEKLLALRENTIEKESQNFEDTTLIRDLCDSWSFVISDEKVRLETIRERRDEFQDWSSKAQTLLSSTDKKLSLSVLNELADEASMYPLSAEVVRQVQKQADLANVWAQRMNEMIKSGEKTTEEETKARLAEGEKLNVICPEAKTLRTSLRTARGWAMRVKKCGLDQGKLQISEIKALIAEHDAFLVCMPDELTKLKQALCGYCICRRPYEGFMIGCDNCDEWFHGPCIGVSEQQAERYDKYMCVRCCTNKIYKTCADSVAIVIRKWTNPKELAKARSHDSQKHNRKVRKEDRDIIKFKADIKEITGNEHENTKPDNVNANDNPTDSISSSVESSTLDTMFPSSDHVFSAEVPSSPNHQYEIGQGAISLSKVDTHSNEGDPKWPSGHLEKKSQPSDKGSTSDVSGASQSEESRDRLEKAKAALNHCYKRLELLDKHCKERKAMEDKEDLAAHFLKRWCIMVRSSIIAPSTNEEANISRPPLDGNISEPMKRMVNEAVSMGISELNDVSIVINAFSCFSWCLRAFTILARKPRNEEIKSLVSQSENNGFKLPEEKSVRMLRSMLNRASLWQAKVKKALAPIPGEKKPFDVGLLKELKAGAREIPMIMAEEAQLSHTIEDNGARHCVCGGPSDGSFMLGCDQCDRWYHGTCLQLDMEIGNELSNWICSKCAGCPFPQKNSEDKSTESNKIGLKLVADKNEDISPHAPNPGELWPPFGLANSDTAAAAVGALTGSEIEEYKSSTLTNSAQDTVESLKVKAKHISNHVDLGGEFVMLHAKEQATLNQSQIETHFPMPSCDNVNQDGQLVCDSSSSAVVSSILPSEVMSDASSGFAVATEGGLMCSTNFSSTAVGTSSVGSQLLELEHSREIDHPIANNSVTYPHTVQLPNGVVEGNFHHSSPTRSDMVVANCFQSHPSV